MRTNDWVGKRKAARQPVNMRGEIRFLDGRAAVECKITDISATGCAVELSEELPGLDDFDLFIEARNEVKICKVRRAAGVKLGVAFLKSRLDDPLVMQTLMERVLRLERGYAELKGGFAGAPEATDVDRRTAAEPRRAVDREAAISGPSIDQRIQSLASGLAELRLTVDQLAATPATISAADLAPRVEQQSVDIASMKNEMQELAGALRGVTLVDAHAPAGAAHVDHTADIVKLKDELANLSVAMRDIASRPELRTHGLAATAREAPAGATTLEIARLRADLSELRASVNAPPAVTFAVDEEVRSALAEVRVDIEYLRRAVAAVTGGERAPGAPGAPAVAPAETSESTVRELRELRGVVKTLVLLVSRTLEKSTPAQAA